MQDSVLNLNIERWDCNSVPEDLLHQCSQLFSQHYGVWGPLGPRPGQSVLISPSRLLKNYLYDASTCSLVTAHTRQGQLLGHAFSCRFPYKQGNAVWITQLVVSSKVRHIGIATALLKKACLNDNLAWGIATSNPYGVRALEKAVGKKCEPEKMIEEADALVQASRIEWFQKCKLTVDNTQSIIHANFFVDHTTVNTTLKDEKEWRLGWIEDGDEFFAFCFNTH